jgi:hypothetical protein
MLRDDLPPREPARDKATRRWRNHDVEKRVKEEKAKAEATPPKPKELEVGDVIENDRVVAEAVTQFQTKFANEIRSMLEGHTKRNTLFYKLSIRNQIRRLKFEKLKRLEARAAQRNQEQSNV